MRIIATLPTYNEAENIEPLIHEILRLGNEFEALVIDDDSPDGTWRIVEKIAVTESRVHLLHRINKRGRGTAGLDGFIVARDELHADAVVEMDADFSHTPRFIPSLMQPIRDNTADIVIGSRLVEGGTETGRNAIRKYITFFANKYIQLMLGLKLRDCTSGFRIYNRKALTTLKWEDMTCIGPEIVQEILLAADLAGLRFAELPIVFEQRRAGQSTFNVKIMIRSLKYMWRLRTRRKQALRIKSR